MFDKWSEKRMSNGAVDTALISSHDMPLVHIINDFFPWPSNDQKPLLVVDYWQLNSQYAFVMTSQQQDTDYMTTQGIYLLQDHVPTWELQYCLHSHELVDSYVLPWMRRPVQMKHSPMRWWFANRPAEASTFCSRIQRIMTPIQWRRAGLEEKDLSSEYENILSLMRYERDARKMSFGSSSQLHFL